MRYAEYQRVISAQKYQCRSISAEYTRRSVRAEYSDC